MAVYTEIADEEVAGFINQYDLGKVVACKGIAEGIENTNYLLVTERGTFILTLYEKRVKTADLPFFLALMDHLASRGFPCPTPVPGCDGRVLRSLAGRAAAVVTFLSGMWPRRPTAAHCAELGEAMAGMHLAAADFDGNRENDLSLSGWRPLYEVTVRRGHTLALELRRELEDELAALEVGWPRQLPRGIIHADLFPDNVFFAGGKLSGIIDFYFACRDFYAYDLAISLNAWCFETDGSFNVTKARRLVRAYRAARELTAEELDALPVLARGAAMRFLLTRLYDWLNTPKDALVTRKNPMEYLQKMRFHRGIRGFGGYGLD
jgi:homoserine kinase type II